MAAEWGAARECGGLWFEAAPVEADGGDGSARVGLLAEAARLEVGRRPPRG